MKVYYNDVDLFSCEWLRRLIAAGERGKIAWGLLGGILVAWLLTPIGAGLLAWALAVGLR